VRSAALPLTVAVGALALGDGAASAYVETLMERLAATAAHESLTGLD
jgi:hypothetical protein